MSLFAHFFERLEVGARGIIPYGVMGFLLIMNSVSVPFASAMEIKAPLFLMGLYYWSVFRPALIPPWMAFLAGIFADLVGGLPLGLNAGAFLLAQWVVTDQRRFLMGQPFVMIWFGFIVVSFLSSVLQWLVFNAVNFSLSPISPAAFSFLLGVALFPLICFALHGIHRILTAHGRALE